MVKNMMLKIISISIIIFIIFGSLQVCEAAGQTQTDDPFKDPEDWHFTIAEDKDIIKKAGEVLGWINTIGITIAVLALAILGIKYMLGSVQEKADYKKSFIPYIIGIFLLVAATTLPNIIYTITNGVTKVIK